MPAIENHNDSALEKGIPASGTRSDGVAVVDTAPKKFSFNKSSTNVLGLAKYLLYLLTLVALIVLAIQVSNDQRDYKSLLQDYKDLSGNLTHKNIVEENIVSPVHQLLQRQVTGSYSMVTTPSGVTAVDATPTSEDACTDETASMGMSAAPTSAGSNLTTTSATTTSTITTTVASSTLTLPTTVTTASADALSASSGTTAILSSSSSSQICAVTADGMGPCSRPFGTPAAPLSSISTQAPMSVESATASAVAATEACTPATTTVTIFGTSSPGTDSAAPVTPTISSTSILTVITTTISNSAPIVVTQTFGASGNMTVLPTETGTLLWPNSTHSMKTASFTVTYTNLPPSSNATATASKTSTTSGIATVPASPGSPGPKPLGATQPGGGNFCIVMLVAVIALLLL